MRTALHSLLICSVISGMAAGGKSSGVMSTERCIDSILRDYVKIANDADFHNETNNYRSVFQHSLRCKSSPECRCGVYSFLEVKSLQEALLSKQDTATNDDTPLVIKMQDKEAIAGMINIRNVMNLALTTPSTKTIAAAFSINAADNLVCGHRGTIFTTLVSWGNSILKHLELLNELVFYVTCCFPMQPAVGSAAAAGAWALTSACARAYLGSAENHISSVRSSCSSARRQADGMSEGCNLRQRWEAQVREEGEPRRDGEISQMQPILPNFWASKLNEPVHLPSRHLGLSLAFSGVRHRPFLAYSETSKFRRASSYVGEPSSHTVVSSCTVVSSFPSTIAAARPVQSRFFAPLELFVIIQWCTYRCMVSSFPF